MTQLLNDNPEVKRKKLQNGRHYQTLKFCIEEENGNIRSVNLSIDFSINNGRCTIKIVAKIN